MVIFYKILNNLTPPYLQDFVPPLVQEANPYRLRNSNNILTIYADTNLYYNSFYPSTIRDWNNLPQEIKESSSVASFKYHLNKDTQRRTPPKFISAGSRLGQILHARIQIACSSLNSELYRKKYSSQSFLCLCEGGGLKVLTIFSSYAQITMQHKKDT